MSISIGWFHGADCRITTMRQEAPARVRVWYVNPNGVKGSVAMHGCRDTREAKEVFKFERYL